MKQSACFLKTEKMTWFALLWVCVFLAPVFALPDSTMGEALSEIQTESDGSSLTSNEDVAGQLESMVVSETSEMEQIRKSAMTVTVIDGKKLHGRHVSIDEVLNRAMGVDVRSSGGLGSSSRIAIRGLDGKRVKYFVDGAPVGALDGKFQLDNLPIQLVDRIEVYKGITPARLGADALGGAVNVVLTDLDVDYLDASYSLKSYNTHKGMFRARKNWLDPGIELGVGLVPTWSDNDYKMDISFVDDEKYSEKVKREHDRFWWIGWGAGLTFTKLWFDEVELELEGFSTSKQNQGIEQPTFHTETRTDVVILAWALEKEDFFIDGLDLDYHGAWLPYSVTHHVDTTHIDRQWDGSSDTVSVRGELGMIPHLSYDTLMGHQQRLNLYYELNENIRFNLNDVFQDMENSPDDPLGDSILDVTTSDYPARMISNSLGLTNELLFGDGVFLNQITGKVHYLNSKIYGRGMYQVDFMEGVPYQGKNNDVYYGWSEAIRARIHPTTSLKLSYENAVRLPDRSELFGNGSNIAPGLDLEAESSDNVNLGVHFQKDDLWGMPRLEMELNGFWRDTRDLIKLEPGFQMSVYKNVQHVRALGIEGEVKADVTRWLYLTANATYQDMRDVDGYKGDITKDLRIPNVPWFFMNFGVEFTQSDLWRKGDQGKIFWEGGYTHEFYSSWKVTDDAEDLVASSFVQNVGIQYDLGEVSVSFEVDDLTNSWLEDEYRMPLPGRTFRANIHVLLMREAE